MTTGEWLILAGIVFLAFYVYRGFMALARALDGVQNRLENRLKKIETELDRRKP